MKLLSKRLIINIPVMDGTLLTMSSMMSSTWKPYGGGSLGHHRKRRGGWKWKNIWEPLYQVLRRSARYVMIFQLFWKILTCHRSVIFAMAWASNPLDTIGFPPLELISVTDPTNLPCPIRHFSSSRSRNYSCPSQKVSCTAQLLMFSHFL